MKLGCDVAEKEGSDLPTDMSMVLEATMAKGGTPGLAPASCRASSLNWKGTCRLAFLLACKE